VYRYVAKHAIITTMRYVSGHVFVSSVIDNAYHAW